MLLGGLGLAGCETDPNAPYLWGIGDPVRGAALRAPRNFGDPARWAGNPANATVAVEQQEFLASELATDPRYAPVVNPAVLQTLQRGRAEMREFLGIPATADPQAVIEAMRRAGAALRAGNPAGAEAALTGPAFPAGPREVLARLGAMPRLPRTVAAAGMVAAEFDRLGQRG
ncbi:MAG: hypothetical protein ACOYOH_23395 [Paracraurococcus sp.]